MALNAIQYTAPQQVTEKKGKKGGGGIGQAVGLVAGGVVGGMAAAAAPAAAPAAIALGAGMGASGGAALGGMLGEKVSPTVQGSTAIDRRMNSSGPQLVQSERTQKLRESVMALHSQPQDVKDQYAPTLVNGYLASLQHDNNIKGNA